ncbi:MAG: hypothetical protein AABW80_04525 [Nanoarchaeota archaeon]
MKLKLISGMVYDICDSVASPPFHSVELTKNKLPVKGKWIIDLKNNKCKNEKGRKIKLTFNEKHHKWFLKQIKNANIPLEAIDSAELIIEFNLKNRGNANKVSCKIECAGRVYYHEKFFSIFMVL